VNILQLEAISAFDINHIWETFGNCGSKLRLGRVLPVRNWMNTWVFCVTAANNNCIPAHSGGNGSLIILHGARGSKPDPRLTDAVVGRSHDLRQPGGTPASSNDVLSTLTELKPLQTYNQQPGYLSPYPGPYDGAGAL